MTNIDFIGKRKIYYTISLSLITIGIIISVIFGVKMDIQFKGGTIIQYKYTGTIDKDAAADIASDILGTDVTTYLNTNIADSSKILELDFDKTVNETSSDTTNLYTKLSAKFNSNNLSKYAFNTVDPSMGKEFFEQSIFAVLLACFLIVVYIWIRFRKIGGLPAGITAFIALLHDVMIAFVAFSVFRIPINDNFVAVALTILGYSINDTIVIFDRIRENRKAIGNKLPFKDIVNLSINQSFTRSINTSFCTFMAIAVICIFSIIYGLDSITSFALPMMIGVVSGCYSTICIAGPLWVSWETYKENKALRLAAAKTAAKAAVKAAASVEKVSSSSAEPQLPSSSESAKGLPSPAKKKPHTASSKKKSGKGKSSKKRKH